MSYSPALQYFMDRLEGLSVGVFRLEAQNQTMAIPSQSIMRFTLPSNALVDMHSFALHFQAQTTAAAGTVAPRLPAKISTLLNRVEVSIGGVSVAAGCNFYNTLHHALAIVDGEKEEDAGLSHPAIIVTSAADNYVYGGAAGAAITTQELPPPANGAAQFCIDKWHGFIGECQPRVLDTSLLGDIVITCYLEQPQLCMTVSDNVNNNVNFTSAAVLGGYTSNYQLNNVYASVQCYSLANGVYDNMIADQMASAGNLEVGFKQYFSFRDNNTGVSRWTVATQSLDRVVVCHNANVAGGNVAPILCSGYNDLTAAAQLPRVLNAFNKYKYLQPCSQFTEAATASKNLYEFALNGARYPQWRATAEDMYNIMRLASRDGARQMDWGLRNYLLDYFVQAIKLTLDAPNARFAQGLDTRSVSLNGYYYIHNINGNQNVTIFAECTSSLLIGAGRQIEVIQ